MPHDLSLKIMNRGFTLIEIMITMVVIAIVVSLSVVSLSSNPANELDREAARLQRVIQLAADDAVVQGVEFGLVINGQGYYFLFLDAETLMWSPVVDTAFRAYEFPEQIQVSIEIDGENIDDEVLQQLAQLQNLSDEEESRPSLLLLSSGELTPFTIQFSHSAVEQSVLIMSDGVSGVFKQ
jgi:general secretion pathway protein H